LLLSSAVDLTIISMLAVNGVLMTALPISVLLWLGAAAIAFAFVLDAVKVALFHRLDIA
jgi:H+-transporting ATPase